MLFNSKIEQAVYTYSTNQTITTQMPYLRVDNFPELGLVTALRFLEWAAKNPEGVISLPTGKTPEYFIKYTRYLLENWNNSKGQDLRIRYNLDISQKPDLSQLRFVQIDEFYPIDAKQHNSFYNYVDKYYIKGFGLSANKALLMDSNKIPLHNRLHFSEVFPNYAIDLSLRFRSPKSRMEEIQQKSIFMIDQWCSEYEQSIRAHGGIGFFLGGIGPDGHIAFNVKGSQHYSTTRLTATNFETQAVAAGDLGGIEVSKNRLVITIGLETITYNPNVVAIIFAAGEAKADIVKQSLENKASVEYPASALHKCKNARFYLTQGAATKLKDSINHYYFADAWNDQKTERAIIDLSKKIDKYVGNMTMQDLNEDEYCKHIPNKSADTLQTVINSVKQKLELGMQKTKNEIIYHTGPHHDDILLGIFPYVNRQLRSHTNDVHFSVLTSGFTAVTNSFVIKSLKDVLYMMSQDKIQMLKYPDFFDTGYKQKTFKDVSNYLDAIAENNAFEKRRGVSHRIIRALVEIYKLTNATQLENVIHNIIEQLQSTYSGAKDKREIQLLKGMIREFEEDLVWGHYGVPASNVHHLRLGFYKGDIFTEQPNRERDILPVLEEFRKYQPTTISLTMDPEGSGPDTHYKVLQTIAGAVKEWQKEKDLSHLKIMGYRNVWFRYHPADINMIIPVSLNTFDIMQNTFSECYLSQVNASFPSYEYNGKFSELAQRICVEQLRQMQLVLGKDYFYSNALPLLRATHGIVYAQMLTAKEFVKIAENLEKVMEGVVVNNKEA